MKALYIGEEALKPLYAKVRGEAECRELCGREFFRKTGSPGDGSEVKV